jgi:predicted O-linked N-acetylglucosamine transferase (SPINDLY family)
LARHRHADLFLDTLPCNAHTTASDALWAGLPVLTCAGETFAGRVAGSIVRAAGLSELVASSPRDYEALALALARDPARLADIRSRLGAGRENLPLFDMAKRTRDLEALYARMAETWRSGQPATPISL